MTSYDMAAKAVNVDLDQFHFTAKVTVGSFYNRGAVYLVYILVLE